ncbi:MFS transporter [Catellatospora tritici]|uniref:MFS transporter n=1 Tax=Catellatospora tritici TaxID=2851566 RepID=UPI001C2DC0F4|nr:MFS transporter [Catellatospora tritici]MBV1850170.1 MFS transporter [Catellatospora tritici]
MSSQTLAERLGLPRTRGNGRLLTALAIDALGNGLMAPFLLLFLGAWTGLDLLVIGSVLTAARLAALPLGVAAGPFTDRIGPRRALVCSGLAQAAGMGGFLLCTQAWQVAGCALLAAVGDATFWVAHRSMTAAVVPEGDRPRWLGAQIALRNGAFALGGLAAALVVAAPGRTGLAALVAVNAASFLALAALVGTWHPATLVPSHSSDVDTPSYRVVLADRAYLLFVGVNLLLVVAMATPALLLAVYVGDVLHGPVWLVGVAFTVETVLIALCQTVVGRLLERHRRTTVLRWAALAFAASFLAYALLPAVPASLLGPCLIGAVLITTVANLLEGPTGIGLVTDAAPDRVRGRYTAVYQLSWNIGKAITPGAAAWLLDRGPAVPWLTLTACCALAYALLTRLARLLPTRVDNPRHASTLPDQPLPAPA